MWLAAIPARSHVPESTGVPAGHSGRPPATTTGRTTGRRVGPRIGPCWPVLASSVVARLTSETRATVHPWADSLPRLSWVSTGGLAPSIPILGETPGARTMTRAVGRAFISVVVLTRCSALAAEPPQSGSRMPAFQAPPGFVVERVAGPPLVRYPLFAEFDDRGRLFVAEGTGTNLPADELRKPEARPDHARWKTRRRRRLRHQPRLRRRPGLPTGVLWHDGAVYAASHPSLWKLEDPDEDRQGRPADRAGHRVRVQRQRLRPPRPVPGARRPALLDRRPPRLQGADARRGRRSQGLAARIWRCRTDGREVERLCGGGFDNPVEVAFTPEGELIGTMDQGPGDCLLHYVEGGVYPMEHPCLEGVPRTGPLLGRRPPDTRPCSPPRSAG